MKRWKRLAAGALAFVLASGGGTSFLGEGLEEVRADNCGERRFRPDEGRRLAEKEVLIRDEAQ